MSKKTLNLVKYAGEFWVTLADFTETRDTKGYSGEASVKSAVRTFVVKENPDKYIAFRGEIQLKSIIAENKHNPLFHPEDFSGTRTALIGFSVVKALDERFPIRKDSKQMYEQFLKQAAEYMKNNQPKVEAASSEGASRSTALRHIRQEIARTKKEIDIRVVNLEKLQQAASALESLQIEGLG